MQIGDLVKDIRSGRPPGEGVGIIVEIKRRIDVSNKLKFALVA